MRRFYLAGLLLLAACGRGGPSDATEAVVVAAASNLDRVIPQLMEGFEKSTGLKAVASLGSTSNLTQQIKNGAPFDIFLSADAAHVDQLIGGGFAEADSKQVYARGRLALWARNDAPLELSGPEALLDPRVKYVAMANPAFAPYGIAAGQALDRLGYLDRLKGKIVYAQDVSMTQQYAASGKADIAVTALSLAIEPDGKTYELDGALYEPIEQALAILVTALHKDSAYRFAQYMSDPRARDILNEFGYGPGD